jgi:hypothetical protein
LSNLLELLYNKEHCVWHSFCACWNGELQGTLRLALRGFSKVIIYFQFQLLVLVDSIFLESLSAEIALEMENIVVTEKILQHNAATANRT